MSRVRYTAILLAGDRGANDPVARAAGAPCKALVPVAGTPMVWRVIATLKQVDALDSLLLVGPAPGVMTANPAFAAALQDAGVRWIAPGATPSTSATRALAALGKDRPAIITTADHALLTPTMIEALIADRADNIRTDNVRTEHDISVGLIAYARVRAAYPASKRTAIRLAPAPGYCSCNLFAIHSARGRTLVARWRAVETQRKHPARVIARLLGPLGVARYALGRLDLAAAFTRLSARTGLRLSPVLLSEPEAAVDVDSPTDLQLVESILARRAAT